MRLAKALPARGGWLPAGVRKLPPLARLALFVLLTDLAIAAVALPVLWGRVEARESDLRRLEGQIQSLRAETRRAQQDHAFVTANADRYGKVLASGLFDRPDRLTAKHRLNEVYVDDYLTALDFEFSAAQRRPLATADRTLVATPLRLEARAMLDRDVYMLIRDLERGFPGATVLRGLALRPEKPIASADLRKIAAGEPVPFVAATLTYDWRTVERPDDQAPVVAAKAPAPAGDPKTVPETLMFTVEDMVAIERAIAAGPLARGPRDGRDADTRLRGNLYLSAIVYSGPQAWTVWINGHRYTPVRGPEDYEVVAVSARDVEVRVPWGKDNTRVVRLAPHQTFVPAIGGVVEGRFH